jgi:transcriptional regulator with XRE-family HTH domain
MTQLPIHSKTASTLRPMARKPRSKAEKAKDLALGQRVAALRRERGTTQTELAEQLGTTQGIISDYECGKLRPHADMIVRLAKALRVSTDEVLGVKPPSKNGATVSRRVLRRLTAIDGLPKRDQDALFRTIDAFLQARKAS